jgi:hypothetical protein
VNRETPTMASCKSTFRTCLIPSVFLRKFKVTAP